MSSPPPERRNPLYLLLLVVGVLFVATALAYAIIPVMEKKAADAGTLPPPSAFRDALRADGGTWLLVELAAMAVLGVASMVVDRLRSLKSEQKQSTISAERTDKPPS
jgi:hypothetical protein